MLNEDFKDLLSLFIAEKVEFLLVGAYAIAAHGLPRSTGDIDVWVRPTPENAIRVFRALAAFGAPLSGVTPQDFISPDLVFQIGQPPRRIDVLSGVSGLTFDDPFSRSQQVCIDGLQIRVLAIDDLICNKRASGRPKDLVDVAQLERVRRKQGLANKK